MNEPDAIEPLQVAMITIDAMAVDQTAKEEFKLQVQLSIERIRANDAGYAPTRPRKATDGVIALNQYENRSHPAGIRRSVKAIQTEHARAAHIKGTVRLKILVAADGRPARAYILKRAGFGLDQRAVQAVLQYKFEPAMLGGLPQTGWFFLDVKFS
jgi:protein TonB